MKRKGDIFALQEFFIGLILVVLCLLFFGIYWMAANQFADKVNSPTEITDSLAATSGGSALRVHLRTTVDELPMPDALIAALHDTDCVSWLDTKQGTASTACQTLDAELSRFFTTFCESYLYEASLEGATFRHGPGVEDSISPQGKLLRHDHARLGTSPFSAPLTPEMLGVHTARNGIQILPTAAGVLTTRLLCIDKEVGS